MKLEEILFNRLATMVDDPDPLGNLVFVEDSNLYLIWDVPFNSGTEAVLFQRIFLTIIASEFYNFTKIAAQVSNDEITIAVEDDSGPIVKPFSVFASSKIHSFGNHFKGQILLQNILKDKENFVKSVKKLFHSTLKDVNLEDIKI